MKSSQGTGCISMELITNILDLVSASIMRDTSEDANYQQHFTVLKQYERLWKKTYLHIPASVLIEFLDTASTVS
jgi:hypothetical protein